MWLLLTGDLKGAVSLGTEEVEGNSITEFPFLREAGMLLFALNEMV